MLALQPIEGKTMDKVEQLRRFFEAATEHGWATTNVGIAIRMTDQTTPSEVIEAGWYPSSTYQCSEVLDFTFVRRDRVPIVVYKDRSRPWIEGTDTRISYRKALELLSQPLAESEFHKH